MTKEERRRERIEGWIRALQWTEKHLKKKARDCVNENYAYAGAVLEGCANALRDNYIDVVMEILRDMDGDTPCGASQIR